MADERNISELSVSDRYEKIFRDSGIKNLVYIDVDQLNSPDDAENGRRLKEMVESQSGQALSHLFSDWENSVRHIKARSPSVAPASATGTKYGLVIRPPASFDDKYQAVAKFASGSRILDRIENIPGEAVDYIEAFAAHEIKHLETSIDDLPHDNLDFMEQNIRALTIEVKGDRNMVDFLRETGRPEVAQFLTDIRAIRSVLGYDLEHGTSPFLGEGDQRLPAPNDYLAMQDIKSILFDDVSQHLTSDVDPNGFGGIDDLFKDFGEEKVLRSIDTLMANGKYNDRPELKAYIQDFSDAYRRQIFGENIPARQLETTAEKGAYQETLERQKPTSDIIPNSDFTAATNVGGTETTQHIPKDRPERTMEQTL